MSNDRDLAIEALMRISATPPVRLNASGVPRELRDLANWVAWRLMPPKKPGDKFGKVPVNPATGGNASSTKAETWGTFDSALDRMQRDQLAGVGFVFTNSGIVGIDLDHCRDPKSGGISAEAMKIIKTLDSFTEVSPSGTGIHVYVRGKLPGKGRREGFVEIYDTGRFFTVTGVSVPGIPSSVAERQEAVSKLHAQLGREAGAREQETGSPPRASSESDDGWVIENARKAKNGSRFQALMAGDTTGYSSASEATSALLCMLAFWTRHDAVQMDRVFRTSGMMREKWDEKRGDSTWGQQEIARALEIVKEDARVAPMSASASNGREAQRPVRELLIPGGHSTPKGYIEVSTLDFATAVLNVLPLGTMYLRGQVPGEITGEPGSRGFSALTPDRARLLIDGAAHHFSWVVRGSKKEMVRIYEPCTRDHAGLVLGRAIDHSSVGELKAIIRSPSFAGPRFERLSAGFNTKHSIYYDEHPSLRDVKPIRDQAEINTSLTDLLIDFPFEALADWENFIGLLLLPIVRNCIVGNLPLHLVLSCLERSGKSKLIELVLGRLIQGGSIPAVTLSENEDEREKRILSLLLSGAPIVHLDNLPPYIDSRVLASLITAETFQGRILGISKMACVRNDIILVGSGNNVRASSEISKRVVPIRLLPKTSSPEARTEFRHPDLPAYLESVRPRVLGAVVGMVLNWIDAGRPRSRLAFGGFEDFTAVVGGILEVQGFKSWLSNRSAWVGDADLHSGDLETLVEMWKSSYSESVTPAEVYQLARSLNLFPDVIHGRDDHADRSNFGRRVLLAATSRPVLGMRITSTGTGSSRRYRLTPIEGGAA